MELAGLLGDVNLLRGEAGYVRTGAALGGRWRLQMGLALAKPLKGPLPFEAHRKRHK